MDRKPPAVTALEIVLIVLILAAACYAAGANDLLDVITNR
jgi:hypothetical protein